MQLHVGTAFVSVIVPLKHNEHNYSINRGFPLEAAFILKAKIVQFPVRFCLCSCSKLRGFFSKENSPTSPLFWSQAASIGMVCQVSGNTYINQTKNKQPQHSFLNQAVEKHPGNVVNSMTIN